MGLIEVPELVSDKTCHVSGDELLLKKETEQKPSVHHVERLTTGHVHLRI